MRDLLAEYYISILGKNIGIRIYKDGDRYEFEPSEFLQESGNMNVYKPGSGGYAHSLGEILDKIEFFRNSYTNIVRSEPNPNY
jgi:hypothetical protein